MLKKIYNSVMPDFLKQKIREKSPYYHRFLELQKDSDAAAANYQNQLDAARSQLEEKDQKIARITADSQSQLDAALRKLEEKDQEIKQTAADYQKLLDDARSRVEQKDQEIRQTAADYQKLLDDARSRVEQKDQEIKQTAADYQKLLDDARSRVEQKDQEISRMTVKISESEEKLLESYKDYQFSLKQILRDPSVREEHLCGICGNLMRFSFSKKVMNKYDVSYFACEHCNHVQTEKPYWLEDAYHSPLSDSDTGQVWRNERNRDIVCAIVQKFMPQSPKVLEYAAGYGLLTRMLRDSGLESFWYDKYAQNVFARYFEDDGKREYDLVLAFEALEHFEDPMQELENIFKRGKSLLFSEVLLPDLCPNQWWYLCTEHGQHINFYSRETLQYIAGHFHRNLYFHEDVGLITPLEIKQEDFAETLSHADVYAKAFRESHQALTLADMNTVIKKVQS